MSQVSATGRGEASVAVAHLRGGGDDVAGVDVRVERDRLGAVPDDGDGVGVDLDAELLGGGHDDGAHGGVLDDRHGDLVGAQQAHENRRVADGPGVLDFGFGGHVPLLNRVPLGTVVEPWFSEEFPPRGKIQ